MEIGLVRLAKMCGSMEEFAERLGWKQDLGSFTEYIEEKVDSITALVRRNQMFAAAAEAYAAGDARNAKRYRLEALVLTGTVLDAGLLELTSPLLMAPPRSTSKAHIPRRHPVKTKVVDQAETGAGRTRQVLHPKVDSTKLKPVPAEDLACAAIRTEVLGYTGMTYGPKDAERPLIQMTIRTAAMGGPFGRGGRSVKAVCRTLHNRMINHADLEDVPTPFWVVMDQMAEQAGPQLEQLFTKKSIIEAAVKICGEAKWNRCVNAFNLLKTHQDHRSKAGQCYSYIVDDVFVTDSNGKRVKAGLRLRPRAATETCQFFEKQRADLRAARVGTVAFVATGAHEVAPGKRVPRLTPNSTDGL